MDTFAATDARVDLLRSVAHSAVGHEDQFAIIGPQNKADVLLRGAIGANQQQVRGRLRQNFPEDPVALELASGDSKNTTLAGGRVAELKSRRELHSKSE